MPIFQVKKNFPSVKILPGDYKSYARYSGMMFDVVRRYADDVEEYSIDECFADLTGLEPPLRMTYRQIAERIKREINNELKLSVSLGLAPTKVLAKVASKWKKPGGLTVIEEETAQNFLEKTPIEKIWGIGPRTSAFLQKKGVVTAADFTGKNIAWVKQNLTKPYEAIWHELHCVSVMPIDPKPKTVYSSIQKTRTFHPATNDKTFLLSQIAKNMEDTCAKARHFHLAPKKVSFFLKTQSFKYAVCSMVLPAPCRAPEILLPLAREKFPDIHSRGVMYRTTGVALHELVSDSVSQKDLFGAGDRAEKFEEVHKRIDALQTKFGKRVVYLASTHTALKHKEGGTDADDPDRNLLFL